MQLFRAMVPVDDFLGKPVLDRRFGLGDQPESAVTDFLQMLRHNLSYGVCLRLLLQLAGDPCALWTAEDRVNVRLVSASGR